jgi:hypothetical protein
MAETNLGTLLEVDPANAGKVVELPNLVTGRLADIIAAASATGSPRELAWEQSARSAFRTEAANWRKTKRFWWRNPAAAVVASVSLLFATSGLAAATGFPAPEARVVDQVLKSVDINVQAPGTSGPTAPSGASAVPTLPAAPPATLAAGPRLHAMRRSTCLGQSLGSLGATSYQLNGTSSSFACEHHQPAVVQSGSSTRSGAGGQSGSSQGSSTVGTVGTSGVNQSPQRGAGAGVGTKRGTSTGTGTAIGPGTNRGGNRGTSTGTGTGKGTGTGTGPGPGTNRGGNRGTGKGTGTGPGPGTNRGGNRGTGTGTGTGKGTGTGPGPGTNRGGNRGTGTGNGKGAGTGPGPGTNRGGNRGTGTGGGGGAGNRHPGTTKRKSGESAQSPTAPSSSAERTTRVRLTARSSLRARR